MTNPRPLDLSRPVRTKSGLPVRVLCTDRNYSCEEFRDDEQTSFPILGLVCSDKKNPHNENLILSWTAEGVCEGFRGPGWNLENVPIHRTGWVVVNAGTTCLASRQVFPDQEKAKAYAQGAAWKMIPIEWED